MADRPSRSTVEPEAAGLRAQGLRLIYGHSLRHSHQRASNASEPAERWTQRIAWKPGERRGQRHNPKRNSPAFLFPALPSVRSNQSLVESTHHLEYKQQHWRQVRFGGGKEPHVPQKQILLQQTEAESSDPRASRRRIPEQKANRQRIPKFGT